MEQLALFKNKDRLEEAIEQKVDGLESSDVEGLQIFKRRILYALLNSNPQRYSIIDRVIDQVKDKGLSYVLCKVSEEARKFYQLARAVSAEKYRATAFIRLQPIDQHRTLFGEFEIRHNTAELIMQHFIRRFPTYNIMLIFGREAYLGRNNEIFKKEIERQKLTLPKEQDEYERYWLAFYRSQFIAERKNLRYLKRMIPKKYWRWVTELQEFGIT